MKLLANHRWKWLGGGTLLLASALIALSSAAFAREQPALFKPAQATLMWINPLDLLPGDASVQTSFNAVSSGVGGGLSGLIVGSSTTGDTASSGGNKVIEKGLEIPPGYLVKGVRVCYESSNARSFITQIRLSQVQDPPSSAIVRLDDGTDLTNPGPICVNSQSTAIDPKAGAVFLSLRTNFGNTSDLIVIRALGLFLEKTR
jgi:hypothetical protein